MALAAITASRSVHRETVQAPLFPSAVVVTTKGAARAEAARASERRNPAASAGRGWNSILSRARRRLERLPSSLRSQTRDRRSPPGGKAPASTRDLGGCRGGAGTADGGGRSQDRRIVNRYGQRGGSETWNEDEERERLGGPIVLETGETRVV